jgi:hypothetical protein
MKKFIFVAATVAFMLYGCSDNSDPLGPSQTSSVAPGAALGKASTTRLIAGDALVVDPNILSTSTLVSAKAGGIVALRGSFLNAAGESVSYNLSIAIPAGALPSDQTISITINKTTFADNADVTFGPSGLVFNTPATLYVWGTNVDVAKKAQNVYLQYWDGSKWVPYPGSWGYYSPNFSGIVFASGKIPHFSRYAFAR